MISVTYAMFTLEDSDSGLNSTISRAVLSEQPAFSSQVLLGSMTMPTEIIRHRMNSKEMQYRQRVRKFVIQGPCLKIKYFYFVLLQHTLLQQSLKSDRIRTPTMTAKMRRKMKKFAVNLMDMQPIYSYQIVQGPSSSLPSSFVIDQVSGRNCRRNRSSNCLVKSAAFAGNWVSIKGK